MCVQEREKDRKNVKESERERERERDRKREKKWREKSFYEKDRQTKLERIQTVNIDKD